MEEIIGENLDLSHLSPQAQITAMLPVQERIKRIRAERWIGYSTANQALVSLEELFTWPERVRMQNMLLIGPTNNGKSMIIEKFRRQHLPYISKDGSKEVIPVLVMQMPSDPSIARFYTMLLYAMNAPMVSRRRVQDLEILSLRLMKETKVRMLVIDELHNILAGSSSVRNEFLNLLRFLGNTLHIPIIGVGTEDAYRAIRTDDQLENRFKPFILPRWKDDDNLMSLLASFKVSIPLRRSSELHSKEIARYILARTEGTIGEITALLTYTAIVAIETGEEAINNKTFTMADYDSPTERRRKFEREIV
jgi:hypothetical protein